MAHLLGGFQLPFQRRLTKLYTDTKSSYEFVKEPIPPAEDADLASLQRRLRVQKDRLISWGLEWSDSSGLADIDEALSRAGVGEVVESVMSNIKEMLAEAEHLWRASRPLSDVRGEKSNKSDVKGSIVWDKNRFEDLIKDLTTSIDTLHDLSRTRSRARQGVSPKQIDSPVSFSAKVAQAEQARLYESTRRKSPRQIDPRRLVYAGGSGDMKSSEFTPRVLSPAENEHRRFVLLQNSRALVPMLLEYSAYDPIYSSTGIMPEMERFEKLFAGLQTNMTLSKAQNYGHLELLGYFEDAENARLGLLFELPQDMKTQFEDNSENAHLRLDSLADIITTMPEPPLEVKFRLARNIAASILDIHVRGIVHGNIAPSNVCFFGKVSDRDDQAASTVNLRCPFITTYDIFSESPQEPIPVAALSLVDRAYRHAEDPRKTPDTTLTMESRSIDLFGLAKVLADIALWRQPGTFDVNQPHETSPASFERLARSCGSLYSQTVQACLRATEDEIMHANDFAMILPALYDRIISSLDRCCAIDDGIDVRKIATAQASSPSTQFVQLRQAVPFPQESSLLPFSRNIPPPLSQTSTSQPAHIQLMRAAPAGIGSQNTTDMQLGGMMTHSGETVKSTESPRIAEAIDSKSIIDVPQLNTQVGGQNEADPGAKMTAPNPELRIFHEVHLDERYTQAWYKELAPVCEKALRRFCRKSPESMSMGLSAVGETATTTRPTIVVTCTSVKVVRKILEKHLSSYATTYGLLVEKGQIVRCRGRQTKKPHGDKYASVQPAKNPGYQEKPFNGASIGAYVEGQNLPPVSYGGLIQVGDKQYGLTVHHMLDDPSIEMQLAKKTRSDLSDTEGSSSDSDQYADSDEDVEREITSHGRAGDQHGLSNTDMLKRNTKEYDSDDSAFSESSSSLSVIKSISDSVLDSDDDRYHARDAGDVEGIAEGCGDGYSVTQPAIDDVEEGFYPDEETADEDHLDSYGLGEVYVSSGLRRRRDHDLAHEIDWALFEFQQERKPSSNYIDGGQDHCSFQGEYPVEVAPWLTIAGLEVHCLGRSTGLQKGQILPQMHQIRLPGRFAWSWSFQVSGQLGMPGDSGAWVVDNTSGRLCGHILARNNTQQVAYICPMEIIFDDIQETLKTKVSLIKTSQRLQESAKVEPITRMDQPLIESSKHLAQSQHTRVDDLLPMLSSHSIISQS